MVAVVDAVGELLADVDGDVAACGLDHQGESVLAWEAEGGEPLTPIITWQDKRSQEVLDRLESDGGGAAVRERSGMPLDSDSSAGKLTWLLEHEPEVQRALAAGTLRLGTVDSWLCDMLGSGFATTPPRPHAPSSRCRGRRIGIPSSSRRSAFRASACRRSVTAPATWERSAIPTRRAAAAARTGCGPAGGAGGSRVYGSRPGEGDLRHRSVRARARGRATSRSLGGRLAPYRRLAGGRARRVRARRRCVHRRRAARWLSRDLGLAPDPPALAALAAEVEDSAGARVLPALAGLGAPWWRPGATAVLAGLTGRTRAGHVARAALEAIAWRVADILAVVSEHIEPETLRVDGGLTRDPLLLALQADTAGVPVEQGAMMRRRPAPPHWPRWARGSAIHARDRGADPHGRPHRAPARRRLAHRGA